ncbi:MAG: copper resistance CopC family protein [Pseudomonadota bacterium]
MLPLKLAGAVALALLVAAPVSAHSRKTGTDPADGAVLDVAPETIRMDFDQPIAITMIRLTDGSGAELPVAQNKSLKKVMTFEAVPPNLSAGTYTIEWRGLSDDGHPVQGTFSFDVR